MRTKLWFKVTMATVPDFAAVLGTVMRTAVVDKGLKELNIYHSVLCRQRTQRIKYISFSAQSIQVNGSMHYIKMDIIIIIGYDYE